MDDRLALKERICTEILYAIHDFGGAAINDLAQIADALTLLLGDETEGQRTDIPLYAEIRGALSVTRPA